MNQLYNAIQDLGASLDELKEALEQVRQAIKNEPTKPL